MSLSARAQVSRMPSAVGLARRLTLNNEASGTIKAPTLRLNATSANTLTNRGLIDGSDTFIDAVTLNNLGNGVMRLSWYPSPKRFSRCAQIVLNPEPSSDDPSLANCLPNLATSCANACAGGRRHTNYAA